MIAALKPHNLLGIALLLLKGSQMQFTVNNVFSKLKLWFSATKAIPFQSLNCTCVTFWTITLSCDGLKFIIKSFDKIKLSWNSTIVTGVDYTSSRCAAGTVFTDFHFGLPRQTTQNERTARSLCMIGALSRRISIAACCCTALLMFCFSIVSIHACRNFYPTVLVGVVDKAFRRSPILPLECNCGDHEQNLASSHNKRPVSVDVIVFWKSRQRSMS